MKRSIHQILLFLLLLLVDPLQAFAADGEDKFRPGTDIKVLTFNIRYDNSRDGANRWAARQPRVTEFIKKTDSDIVGLQEAMNHQLQAILKACDSYLSTGLGRDDGKTKGEFSAILYRKDRLELLDSGTFWFSLTPEKPGSKDFGNQIPRICSWGRFKQKSSGKTFMCYNVHLDHQSQESREKSVELLRKRIAARENKDPVIITGDFNAGESNKAILMLTKPDGKESDKAHNPGTFSDTFRSLHPEVKEVGTFHGFKGKPGKQKIDYVLLALPSSLEVRSARIHKDPLVDGHYRSDHLPVEAVVRWKPAVEAGKKGVSSGAKP